MPHDIRIWQVSQSNGKDLQEIQKSQLDLEQRLENWIEEDISIISSGYLIIGRQILTSYGKIIDLLAMDSQGDLIIIELKKDKTPRDVVAQTLDYASWVKRLSAEQVIGIADDYFSRIEKETLDEVFFQKFQTNLPSELNINHSMLIVASIIDESTERIVAYLSEEYGVRLNVLEFSYFTDATGKEFLSRVFLIDPGVAESNTERVSNGKRQKNLTREQLSEIAIDNGVSDWYNQLVAGLSPSFNGTRTNMSALGFVGKNVAGTKKPVILSLIPGKSSPDKGVAFELYLAKLADYCMTISDTIESFLPANREEFHFNNCYEPLWSGYQGYFSTEQEINDFISGIRALKGNP